MDLLDHHILLIRTHLTQVIVPGLIHGQAKSGNAALPRFSQCFGSVSDASPSRLGVDTTVILDQPGHPIELLA